MENYTAKLIAWKTYLAAGAIIVHQVFMLAGIDVPSQTLSELIDGGLATAAIVFRIMGQVQAKKAVNDALYTPPPAGRKPDV